MLHFPTIYIHCILNTIMMHVEIIYASSYQKTLLKYLLWLKKEQGMMHFQNQSNWKLMFVVLFLVINKHLTTTRIWSSQGNIFNRPTNDEIAKSRGIENRARSESWCPIRLTVLNMIGKWKMNDMLLDISLYGMLLDV